MRFRMNWLLIGLVLTGACASAPSGVSSRTVKAGATKPTSAPSVHTLKPRQSADAAAVEEASPSPKLPSASPAQAAFAAELNGLVKVSAASLLANKLAALTPQGTLLISNNGGSLISNNGGGLISNKGMGLISDKGMGLLASDGLRLLSNNSAGLIGKTQYRLLEASASSTELLPVEGMAVVALDLMNGRILAGPAPTDAQGRYSLRFATRPTSNLGILAVVPDAEAAPAMSFGGLARPEPQSTPLVTGEVSQAVAGYLLSVMPYRLQPIIDARKEGRAPDDYLALHQSDPQGHMLLKSFDDAVKMVPAEKLRQADKNGALALGISARAVAFLDFRRPHYKRLEAFAEQIRTYGAGLSPAPTPPLLEQIFTLMRQKGSREPIKALLLRHGMPEAEVGALADEAKLVSDEIVQELAVAIPAHQAEVLGPLLSLLGP